jgi:SAM-dependent methyltransferase
MTWSKKLVDILQRNLKLSKNFNINQYTSGNNIHLGCGNRPLSNFINVDYYNRKHADLIADLEKDLPYSSESIDFIYSDNVFEHIKNLLGLMKECHRVLRMGGFLAVKVPYFKSRHAYVDPTHRNFFTLQSMDYYCADSYFNQYYKFFDESFTELEIFIDPDQKKGTLRKLMEKYALRRPNQYENSILSTLIVFNNLVYVLRK